MNDDFYKSGEPIADTTAPTGPIEDRWTTRKFEAKLVSPANKRKKKIIIIGTGLAGGGTSGDVGLSIAPSFQLPQNCTPHQAPAFAAPAWACGTFAGAGQACDVGKVISKGIR